MDLTIATSTLNSDPAFVRTYESLKYDLAYRNKEDLNMEVLQKKLKICNIEGKNDEKIEIENTIYLVNRA